MCAVVSFFLGKEVKRSRQGQVACSWASIIGYWLSSNTGGTVVHLWSLLAPKVRTTWQVVDAWMNAQNCPKGVREVCVCDAVASYRGASRKTGMLRKFMERVPNTRCVICRMNWFAEEVHGVRLLQTQQFEQFTKVQQDRSIIANGDGKQARRLPTLIEGWGVCSTTFYGFQIVMRSWVCPRQGLLGSSCACDTRKRWRRPFVTPLTEKKLFWPNLFVGQWDEGCKPMFQPGNAMDLEFLGCLQMVGLTLKRSRVCYQNGDSTQPGNTFFAYFAQTGTDAVCSWLFLPFGQMIVAMGNIACWRHGGDGTGLPKWCMIDQTWKAGGTNCKGRVC